MANTAGKGVIYLNVGQSHLERLSVSLWSLRRWWSGAVAIIDGGGDGGALERLASHAVADVIRVRAEDRSRDGVYAFKGSLGKHFPFGVNVWLDADTSVHGAIDSLFDAADAAGLVLTQFSNWVTTGKLMSERLRRWTGVRCPVLDVGGVMAEMRTSPWPAINTGVFAVRGGHPFLDDWAALSAAHPSFICDEIAAQLLLTKHPHAILPDLWNWSPIYGVSGAPVVKHYHGGKHLRHERCRAHWEPLYLEWMGDVSWPKF